MLKALWAQAASAYAAAIGVGAGIFAGRRDLEWLAWTIFALLLAWAALRSFQAVRVKQKRHDIAAPTSSRTDGTANWSWLRTSAELKAYESLCKTRLGEHDYAHADLLTERLKRNRHLVFGVTKYRNGTRELVGAFVAYPLTKETRENLESGIRRNASGMLPSEITPNWQEASAIYVTLVIGRSTRDQADALDELQRLLEWRDDLDTYARPATKRGRALLQFHGFAPVASDHADDVWKRRSRLVRAASA